MGQQLLHLKRNFLSKQQLLEKARINLKQEFIGIDKVIDEVIDNVGTWFTLHELQDKPVVINLWGLTGVGKTSMVTRLAELLNFRDKFYRFDLGVRDGNFAFRNAIDDLSQGNDTSPVIIALDEFQHTRTVEGPFRSETGNDHNRKIWELIDTGTIHYFSWKSGLWRFEELIDKLRCLLASGVRCKR